MNLGRCECLASVADSGSKFLDLLPPTSFTQPEITHITGRFAIPNILTASPPMYTYLENGDCLDIDASISLAWQRCLIRESVCVNRNLHPADFDVIPLQHVSPHTVELSFVSRSHQPPMRFSPFHPARLQISMVESQSRSTSLANSRIANPT